MIINPGFDNIDLDKLITWYDGYKQHKSHKEKIDRELMPAAWYPLRWWDCCMPDNEKKETEKSSDDVSSSK